jgi:hypothetical protein
MMIVRINGLDLHEHWLSGNEAQQIGRRTMHTEAKTLSANENQSSFISYLLRDGRAGNIADIQVNAFWTRVAMRPLKEAKKVKVASHANYDIGRPLASEEMRAYEAA